MEKEKKLFIHYGKMLKEKKLVSIGCNKGSLSLKVREKFIIGPSGMDYEELQIDDVNIMNLDGSEYKCNRKVSMDTAIHSAIYSNRDDVQCIIHTHSPSATALAFAGKSIPLIQWGMKLQFNGEVEMSRFYPPTDKRMNEEIIQKLGKKNAVLLKNHGALVVGETPKKALENIVYLEELSQSYLHALMIGKVEEIE